MSTKTASSKVTLTFDLHDLPTAQHRAGLAGLILQIDAMGPDGLKRKQALIPVIDELTKTSAKITFTAESMQGVFDELYAAKLVEVVVATKWPGETKPKPGAYFIDKKDPKTGEMKKSPGFAYDVVQPQGWALQRHLHDGREGWLDLWRQMIWAIPRGGNNVRSRAPFIDCADHRPCGEGASAWTQAVDFQENLAKSQFKTDAISGALMLGAQSINAEGVSFAGRVDHNLLLHFWQLVVMTFIPQVVNKTDAKVERVGYVLSIPDVADLIEFRHEFPTILQALAPTTSKGMPKEACIDLPDQAGLEVLKSLKSSSIETSKAAACKPGDAESQTSSQKAQQSEDTFKASLAGRGRSDKGERRGKQVNLASEKAGVAWGRYICAVESFHMFKLGNNVKLLAFSRVSNRPGLVEDYERIASTFRNPLFRVARMRALIHQQPWHWGMADLFDEYPWPFFLEGDKTPKYLPRFGRDARDQFTAMHEDIKTMKPEEMDDDEKLKRLGVLVRRIIGSYVNDKAAKKLGLKPEKFKFEVTGGEGKKIRTYQGPEKFDSEKYQEAQRRVCDDAFLQIRSRHDDDFVRFFADSICSVGHYFENKAGDLAFFTQVLMTPPDRNPIAKPARNYDDIKTLAMLALSAYSFNIRKREPKQEGSPK